MRLNPPTPASPTSVPAIEPASFSASSAGKDLAAVGTPVVGPVGIDIYQSVAARAKFLSVPAGTDLASMAFPADMDADLFQVSPYKEGIRIQAGVPAMGLDVEDILGQLEARGFALHGLRFSASLAMGVGLGRE